MCTEMVFEKNKMVSNDSKLSNSARNAIKKNLAAAANGGNGDYQFLKVTLALQKLKSEISSL